MGCHPTKLPVICADAAYSGGPRREYFSLLMREINVKYFENGLKFGLDTDYETDGVLLRHVKESSSSSPTQLQQHNIFIFNDNSKLMHIHQLIFITSQPARRNTWGGRISRENGGQSHQCKEVSWNEIGELRWPKAKSQINCGLFELENDDGREVPQWSNQEEGTSPSGEACWLEI